VVSNEDTGWNRQTSTVDAHKKTVRLNRRPTSCQGKPSELFGGEDMSELLASDMPGIFVPYVEIWASGMPLFSNDA